MRDLLIRNGRIVDGTGRAAYESDLAIDDGRSPPSGARSTTKRAA
jgi:N-acyl-D-aspartate/D-glutamate deacylase